MDRKVMIIIFGVLAILIILLMINKKEKVPNSSQSVMEHQTTSEDIVSEFNTENGNFEIKDSSSGEVLAWSMDEKEAERELKFYKEHPTYRANPPID